MINIKINIISKDIAYYLEVNEPTTVTDNESVDLISNGIKRLISNLVVDNDEKLTALKNNLSEID